MFSSPHSWPCFMMTSLWRQKEKFSALLALCAGNSPVTGEFPSQRPALMFSLICALHTRLSNNRGAGDLRRHCAHYDVIVMLPLLLIVYDDDPLLMTDSPDSWRFLSVVCWSCSALSLRVDTGNNSWLSAEFADPAYLISGLLGDVSDADADAPRRRVRNQEESAPDDDPDDDASTNHETIDGNRRFQFGENCHEGCIHSYVIHISSWNNGPYSYETIGNIYRPPHDNNNNKNIETFINEMSPIIDKLKKENSFAAILGDLYINLLQINEREKYEDFFDMMCTNNFNPKIMFPTRIAARSHSLLDQIFCEVPCK